MTERKLMSKEQIEAEIARRVRKYILLSGDKISPKMPLITPLRDPDAFGCNWTVSFVDTTGIPYVTDAFQEVQDIYNLRPEIGQRAP